MSVPVSIRAARAIGVAALLLLVVVPATGMAQSSSPSAPTSPAIELEPVTESGFGVTSVAPVGWRPVGPGLHARGASANDPTVLAIQKAPMAIDSLWPVLLPQVHLSDVPEPVGTHTSPDGTTWMMYHMEPASLAVDLALSEHDGSTWLVMLQATPADDQQLRESVFLPAVDAFAVIPPSPSPAASRSPSGYTDSAVRFPGGAPGVTLAGTLSLPSDAEDGPVPAIVLVSGSGPQDRDESLAPLAAIKPFALIADALASAGVGVLRYDDRGTAQSTGDFGSATVTDFTADAAAAVAYLRTRSDIDPGRIGLLGHSEGGLVVAELAAADPRIAFVVGMAAPATTGVDLLVAQNEAILRLDGTSDAEVTLAVQFARDVFARVISDDRDGAEQVIRAYFGGLWDRQPADVRQRMGDRASYIQSQVDSQMRTLFSPGFRSLISSNAGAAWRQVHVPVLGLFGGKDVQVPAASQAAALDAAFTAAGNEQGTVITFRDANHLFQSADTGAVGEYGSLAQAFTPLFLPTLVDWVTRMTGVAR